MLPLVSFVALPELPDDDPGDDERICSTLPPGALLPLQPGLLTDAHADPVADTAPTGVSTPAETDALVCDDTGTGADTLAVSVAAVSVTPCDPPTKTPPLPVTPVSVEGSLDSPVEIDVAVVAEVAVVVVVVPMFVAVSVVADVVCSSCAPRPSDDVGVDEVWLDCEEHPGLFTDTHASPVAETAPTGVSAPAETDVFDCAETGTGADTSAVSVAVVVEPVVVASV